MARKITTHQDLDVYKSGMDAAMRIYELSKPFPREETYALVDQIRRSSRSVCANIAEAWRKRRYKPAFVSKLSDVEAEAAETQVWLEFAVKCGYLTRAEGAKLYKTYDGVIATIVGMITHAESWTMPPARSHLVRRNTPTKRKILTSSPLHLFTSSPLHLFTSSPLHLFTSSPLHLFTSSPLHLFTSSPLHLNTPAPSLPRDPNSPPCTAAHRTRGRCRP
jgi:four helix bundle protein